MFDEIIGHQTIASALSEYIRRQSVPAGVLLSGPTCSGKLSIALEFARLLNCQNAPAYPYPCCCSNCLLSAKGVQYGTAIVGSREHEAELAVYRQIAEAKPNTETLGRFLQKVRLLMARFSSMFTAIEQTTHASAIEKALEQLKELLSSIPQQIEQLDDDASRKLLQSTVQPIGEIANQLAAYYPKQISIETMRKLRNWSYSEHIEHAIRYRCIIIEHCSQLSTQNLNLILKVLEEPPQQVVFILLSEHNIGLLPTIRSRVHKYSLNARPLSQQQQVIQYLGAKTAPAVDGHSATAVDGQPVTATLRQLFFGAADDTVQAHQVTQQVFDSLGDTKKFLQSINQLVQFASTKPYSRQRDRNLLEMFTNRLQEMLQQEPSKHTTQFCSELSQLIQKIAYRNQALNIRLTDQVIELASGMNKLHAGLF